MKKIALAVLIFCLFLVSASCSSVANTTGKSSDQNHSAITSTRPETTPTPTAKQETMAATTEKQETTAATTAKQEDPVYLAFSNTLDGTKGFIDETGEFAIKGDYKYALGFSGNGLAPAENSDYLWGFINTSGEFVIEPQFQRANRFANGLAAVAVGGEFDSTSGLFLHCQWGYIDETGNWVIEPGEQIFYEANQFTDNGLAAVSLGSSGGSYRFIDMEGNFAFEDKVFLNVTNFSHGMAGVQFRGNGEKFWGYIDDTGEYVINSQFAWAGPFSDRGCALVRDAKDEHTGIIDTSGQWIATIPDDLYLDRSPFSSPDTNTFCFSENGLAVCSKDNRYGFIDESGQVVIDPQYDFAHPFASNGLACVVVNLNWGYINQTGKYVIEPTLGQSWDFSKAN